LSVYGGSDFNNKVNIIGVKCTIKLGKGYLDKELEKLQKRLETLENN
jgi:hypothetical protein